MEKSNRKINANIHIYRFIIKVSNSNNNNNKYCVHVIKTIIYIDIFIIIGRKRMS